MLDLAAGGVIRIYSANVTIRSDGAGATLDMNRYSRHFEVAHGAALHLDTITLVNGGGHARVRA